MGRTGVRCLFALLLPAACGRGDPAPSEAPAPVPEGRLRVAFLGDIPSQLAWGWDWLDAQGWTLWGFSVEAGSPGRVGLRWNDPRRPNAVFLDVQCDVEAARPVRFVIGIRLRPELLGPLPWSCESCGSSYKSSGSIFDQIEICPRCKAPHDLAPEWTLARSRDFRLLVIGDARDVTGSGRLRRRGSAGGGPVLFAGDLPRSSALAPDDAFDIEGMRRSGPPEFPEGTHKLARLLDPGDTQRRSTELRGTGSGRRFEATSDRVTLRGTESTCEILVDGAPVEIADYPFAAWDLDLTWTATD